MGCYTALMLLEQNLAEKLAWAPWTYPDTFSYVCARLRDIFGDRLTAPLSIRTNATNPKKDPVRNRYFKIIKAAHAPPPGPSESSGSSSGINRDGGELSATGSDAGSARPRFVTQAYVAKKQKLKQQQQAQQQRVQSAQKLARRYAAAPPASVHSLLRQQPAMVVPLAATISQDIVVAAYARRLRRVGIVDLADEIGGGRFSPHAPDISEFDMHDASGHMLCASDRIVSVVSLCMRDCGSKGYESFSRKEKIRVINSAKAFESSKITCAKFSQQNPGLFVLSCLGSGSSSGSVQVYTYSTEIESRLITNLALRYRFSPTKSSFWTCSIAGSGNDTVIASGCSGSQAFVTTSWWRQPKTRPITFTTFSKSDILSQTFDAEAPHNLLFNGFRNGSIVMHDRRSAAAGALEIATAHRGAALCDLKFAWGALRPERLVSCAMDGTVRVWDVRFVGNEQNWWRRGGAADPQPHRHGRERCDDQSAARPGSHGEVIQLRVPNSHTKVNVDAFWARGGGHGVLVCGTENGGVWGWCMRTGERVIQMARSRRRFGSAVNLPGDADVDSDPDTADYAPVRIKCGEDGGDRLLWMTDGRSGVAVSGTIAMASLSPECTPLKDAYYTCFNKWYAEELLKGSFGGNANGAKAAAGSSGMRHPVADGCQELFQTYKDCVWRAIREKKIDALIAEARKDEQQ
ncbi:Mitochondrial distribution and morphology protein 35 [Entophlyctis sp. JEL0112]|nr:Mitochondrial distribution and morphology protein 35 [Entophlyctis sp. JEL0112]